MLIIHVVVLNFKNTFIAVSISVVSVSVMKARIGGGLRLDNRSCGVSRISKRYRRMCSEHSPLGKCVLDLLLRTFLFYIKKNQLTLWILLKHYF